MKKDKVERIVEFRYGSYACRNCFSLTRYIYKVKEIEVIACCPDCAREAAKDVLRKKNYECIR